MMQFHNEANIKYLEENYGKTVLPLSSFENESYPGRNPTEALFFYKKGIPLSKARECFFKTLEHYNLFSSRLIMIDHNKFALQYCTDGASFNVLSPVNANSENIDIDDIRKKIIHVKTLPGEPLFALSVVPINDGVLGAISCSHAMADGIALMLFLFAWACIMDGNDFPPPSSQRLFKGNPVDFDKVDKEFIPPLQELSDEIRDRFKSCDVKTYAKNEYFTYEFLNEMKNQAKIENEKYIISNNQIIISFLLKKYHHQILPKTDRIIVLNPVNLRDTHPDIDLLYIGNATFDSLTEFTKSEIETMTIPQIANRLTVSIFETRKENFAREISYMSDYGIEYSPEAIKRRHDYNPETDIVSTNLTHLNDLESMGVGLSIARILNISLPFSTFFMMLKENSGRIFVNIKSMYPLE
jgi:hypothetical protein